MSDSTDYLEVDNPIPGQHYACLSFVSPEKILKEKELFLFNKYMNQRCGEWELKLDEITKDCTEDYKSRINNDIKEALKEELKFTLSKFKSNFEDFKYKYNEDLDKAFSRIAGTQTSVRGVKVRGVYDSIQEAEKKAKQLQTKDRSFHVFVGQVGYWLPWDPNADKVDDEEYLEEGLNNLMKEYKKNEASRDIFYEEQKREKLKDSVTKQMQEEREVEKDALEKEDPWMKSKFSNASSTTTEAPVVEETTTTEQPLNEVNNTVEKTI
jgi:3'-phosphoadenosine 5'-phosphosulfate sulfotransferase